MRVVFAFAVLGTIAGINGVASLMADHDSNDDSLLLAARSEASAPEMMPEAAPAPVAKAQAKSTAGAEPGVDRSTAAMKGAAKLDAVDTSAGKSDAGKSNPAKPEAAKLPCEENTWAYLDGKCAAAKVRKVRVVRPTSANGVALAAPAASPSTPTQAATVDAHASAAGEPSSKSAAAKKPQKTASSPGRPRNPADHPPGRNARAGAGNATNTPPDPFAHGPFAGFFSLFR